MTPEIKREFMEFLRFEKGLSEESCQAYARHVEYLSEEAGASLLEKKRYSQVSAVIRAVKMARKGRKSDCLSQNTTNKVADMASVFFAWATREGLIEHNPMQFGHEFRKDLHTKPEYFSEPSEVLKILRMHPNHSHRDECIARLLLASGIRRKELCALNIKDVDCEKRFITIVEGKGGQYRVAYMDLDTSAYIARYVLGLKKIGYEGEALFFTEKRSRIAPNTLTQWFRRRSKELGFKMTPHMFRHTCGRNMRRNGARLEDIADVLGHKALSSTRLYATLESKEVRNKYDEFHKMGA